MSTRPDDRPEHSQEFKNKQGEYNPEKLRELLEGKFEPIFESDEDFERFMAILEESRLSQIPKS